MVDFACAGVGPGRGAGAPGLQRLDDGLVPGLLAPHAEVLRCPRRRKSSRWTWRWRGSTRPCGFFGKEQAGTLKPNDIYMFRVAAMLGEYAAHGAVLRRYNRSVSKLDGPGAEAVARFQAHLRAAGLSASTVRTYGTLAGEFVAFTGTRGGLACCDANMIGAFVATLAGYQFKTVEQKLCAVRSFLRFASADGLVDGACLEAVPAARSARQARIPSVWDPGEVTRILDAIDRDNPCGKRDYAIILLIARLGLRGVDIRRLEFADFDWPGNRLFVVQAKTGDRVQLPLLKEVGWAVIDYIRHGRPDSDCPQVFLRHLAPIGPFSDQDHLHQILVKHARVAHVPVSEKRRHGMHSLRHSLATQLRRHPGSRPGPARPLLHPDDRALREDHRPDRPAPLGTGHQGQHQRRTGRHRPRRAARPGPVGENQIRHRHPDAAQRLLRPPGPAPVPARQRLPDLPGLHHRARIPARAARAAAPHPHPDHHRQGKRPHPRHGDERAGRREPRPHDQRA